MKTGLSLMFAKRFWTHWALFTIVIPGGMTVGYLLDRESDKEAYAMRGRSNMFGPDYEKLKKSGSTREFWT